MTFQLFLCALKIGRILNRIGGGEKILGGAFSWGDESLSGFNGGNNKPIAAPPANSEQKRLITIMRFSTPLGQMVAGAVEEGICFLEFFDPPRSDDQLDRLKKLLNAEAVVGSHPHLVELERQLAQYFCGNRRSFDLPLLLVGTEFQRRVWDGLRSIGYGQTLSYQQQAERLGMPKAVRAVARANGDNRIAIIIPCHRVIGKNGKLTGYGGGLWRKEFLLRLERHHL